MREGRPEGGEEEEGGRLSFSTLRSLILRMFFKNWPWSPKLCSASFFLFPGPYLCLPLPYLLLSSEPHPPFFFQAPL